MTSSLLTNSAAMLALENLKEITKGLEDVQKAISSGKKVSDAMDNAAYWSIATSMNSDGDSLATVKDALGLGSATLDVTYTATDKSIELLKDIKSRLVAARQPGLDRSKIQAEITQLQQQLRGMSDSSVFSGQNWLAVDSSTPSYNGTQSIVASFSRAGGVVTIGTIDIDITAVSLYDDSAAPGAGGILDSLRNPATGAIDPAGTHAVSTIDISALQDNPTDLGTIEEIILCVDVAMNEMTSSASNLGALKKRVNLQMDFVSSIIHSIERGIGQLVDADMSEESTRLQALQVQQQLGAQSLQIANTATRIILSLFGSGG